MVEQGAASNGFGSYGAGVQVKLTERELRELDQRRGDASRSEYIRSHALPFERRTG